MHWVGACYTGTDASRSQRLTERVHDIMPVELLPRMGN